MVHLPYKWQKEASTNRKRRWRSLWRPQRNNINCGSIQKVRCKDCKVLLLEG